MGEGRDIYHEPQDRVLLRTEDVYQTTADNGVSRYSEQFLELIASFDNSGRPEGFNCQCTVGKSKRGEIFVRLFARVNPQTRVIEEAGFKAHGCLAIIGCASMACTLIEGRTLDGALALSHDELRDAVGGVPEEKANTLYIALEAVRALVGDYLLRSGASLEELDAAVPCNEYSVACTMCEHCSLRDGRIDKQVAQIRESEQCEQRNAVARCLAQVRTDSAQGKLSTPQSWAEAGLVPQGLSLEELAQGAEKLVGEWQREHAPEAAAAHAQEAGASPVHRAARRSRFAPRPVGIPAAIRPEETEQPQEPVGQQPPQPEQRTQERPGILPQEDTVLLEEGPFAGLRIPAGTRLEQVEGEWVLVETGEQSRQRDLEPDPSGIAVLHGAGGALYFYDEALMTGSFARWSFLAAEGDVLVTFAECVREESRRYPRPLCERSLRNEPLRLSEEQVEQAWQRAQEDPAYADIRATAASDGSRYFYSTSFMSHQQAAALAEWDAVGRYMNV